MDQKFVLKTDYQPTGDQPAAIAQLVAGLDAGEREQTLLGVTGSGKTFTMANIIVDRQVPTLDPKPRRNTQAKPGQQAAPTIHNLSLPMTPKTSSSSPTREHRSAPAKLVSSHRLLGLRPIPR